MFHYVGHSFQYLIYRLNIEKLINLSESPSLLPSLPHMSEGVPVSFASLLGDEGNLAGLFRPLPHLEQAGQEAHEKQEGQQPQQGQDGYVKGGELVGWSPRMG